MIKFVQNLSSLTHTIAYITLTLSFIQGKTPAKNKGCPGYEKK